MAFPKRPRIRWMVLISVGMALGILAAACSAGSQGQVAGSATVEAELGIRVLRVSVTAGGGLIDVRYQVTDANKAAVALKNAKHRSHGTLDPEAIKGSLLLIDESSGYALTETTLHMLGRAQASRASPEAGKAYYILFTNTNGLIEPGDRATLMINELRLPHLEVE